MNKKYEIKLDLVNYRLDPVTGKKIYLDGCKSPSITWDDPECAAISCYLDNNHTIHVTIPEDCDECFYVNYTCNDQCLDCDPVRLKICTCDGPEDCTGGCSDCIQNICVSRCEDGEFCGDGDICRECDDDHPCKNGKICIGGRCVCPPDKPYVNSRGECVPCNEDSCPPGFECTSEGCKPVDCIEGVWDPTQEKCVNCLKAGDCDGPNEICVNNECVCAQGFIRDANGNCVEEPSCSTDEDCGDCRICDENGNCIDIVCPSGKICVPGEGCVEECDCDNPGCSNGGGCTKLPNGRCYCHDCGGPCDVDGDCEDDCFCGTDKNCHADNCSHVSCENGTDCPNNCGCNEATGKCNSCDSGNDLLGCSDSDCEGEPCANYGECGDDCACEGQECVDCSNFSCETGDCASHPECFCDVDGKCKGNGYKCEDSLTGKKTDCALEVKLKLKDGCACPVITALTELVSVKSDMVPIGNPSSAPGEGGDVGMPIGDPGNYTTYGIKLTLRKGVARNYMEATKLPMLDNYAHEDIADNDLPLSGEVTMSVFEVVKVYRKRADGTWGVPSDAIYPADIASLSVSGKALLNFSFKNRIPGSVTFPDANTKVRLDSIEIKFSQKSDITFENNCVYQQPQQLGAIILWQKDAKALNQNTNLIPNSLASVFNTFKGLKSSSKRLPLLTWYRSLDNSYTKDDIIRQLYKKPGADGTYTDTLFGPKTPSPISKQTLAKPEGRLLGNRYYKAVFDCGCSDKVVDFGHVVFCSPKEGPGFEMSNCNRTIKLNGPFEPCDVNRDLDLFGVPYSEQNAAQAKWQLIINGAVVEEFQGNMQNEIIGTINSGSKLIGYVYNSQEEIKSASLALTYDGTKKECIKIFELPPTQPGIIHETNVCDRAAGIFKVSFNVSNDRIKNHWPGTNTAPSMRNGNVVTYSGSIGSTIEVGFEFMSGCELVKTFTHNCCAEQIGVKLVLSQPDPCSLDGASLSATFTDGTAIPSGTLIFRNNTNGSTYTPSAGSNDINVITTGVYQAEFTDPYCNKKVLSNKLNISAGVNQEMVAGVSYEWKNQSAYGDPNPIWAFVFKNNGVKAVSVKYHYDHMSPSGSGDKTISIPAGGSMIAVDSSNRKIWVTSKDIVQAHYPKATISNIKIADALSPQCFEEDSASYTKEVGGETNLITGYKINGKTITQNVCIGSQLEHTIEGTPNTYVTVNKGGVQAFTVTIGPSGVGTYNEVADTSGTYKIVSADLGDFTQTYTTEFERIINTSAGTAIEIVSNTCNTNMSQRTIVLSQNLVSAVYNGSPVSFTNNQVVLPGTGTGTLVVTASNGLCDSSLSISINPCDCPEITADVTLSQEAVCGPSSVNATVANAAGGLAPYQYRFDINGTEGTYQASNIKAVNVSEYTTIEVYVKDANGCTSQPITVDVTFTQLTEPAITSSDPDVETLSDGNFRVCDSAGEVAFNTPSFNEIEWSITGSSQALTNNTSPTVVIDVTQFTGPSAQLTVTITSIDGCTATNTVTITKIVCDCQSPVSVNAGADKNSTGTNPVSLSDATANNTSSVLWSTSGTGSFSNASSINPTYTPSAADIANGAVVLTLTGQPIMNNCSPASDTVTITLSDPFNLSPDSFFVNSQTQIRKITLNSGGTAITNNLLVGTASAGQITDLATLGNTTYTIRTGINPIIWPSVPGGAIALGTALPGSADSTDTFWICASNNWILGWICDGASCGLKAFNTSTNTYGALFATVLAAIRSDMIFVGTKAYMYAQDGSSTVSLYSVDFDFGTGTISNLQLIGTTGDFAAGFVYVGGKAFIINSSGVVKEVNLSTGAIVSTIGNVGMSGVLGSANYTS